LRIRFAEALGLNGEIRENANSLATAYGYFVKYDQSPISPIVFLYI